jgi:hypothetical protein
MKSILLSVLATLLAGCVAVQSPITTAAVITVTGTTVDRTATTVLGITRTTILAMGTTTGGGTTAGRITMAPIATAVPISGYTGCF